MAKDTLISQVIEQKEGNEYYKNFKFDYSDRILRKENFEVYEKIVKGLVTGVIRYYLSKQQAQAKHIWP